MLCVISCCNEGVLNAVCRQTQWSLVSRVVCQLWLNISWCYEWVLNAVCRQTQWHLVSRVVCPLWLNISWCCEVFDMLDQLAQPSQAVSGPTLRLARPLSSSFLTPLSGRPAHCNRWFMPAVNHGCAVPVLPEWAPASAGSNSSLANLAKFINSRRMLVCLCDTVFYN